jgi:hypothetical protein
MRSLICTLTAAIAGVVAFSVAPARAQEEDTIEWLGDYQQAIKEAKRTNKPIFLEFRCEA